jgi:hypothetical protein
LGPTVLDQKMLFEWIVFDFKLEIELDLDVVLIFPKRRQAIEHLAFDTCPAAAARPREDAILAESCSETL